MKNIFLLIAFSFLNLSGHAQAYTEFTPTLKQAHQAIFTLEFSKAQNLIEKERQVSPENYSSYYLEGALTAVQLFINDEEKKFESRIPELESIEHKLESLHEDNQWRNLFLAEILVSQAILNGKYRNNFTAAWQFYRAYQLLEENQKRYPAFVPNKVPLGVLYAAIGSLPEDYRSLASMLGISGDVGKGLNMLESAYFDLNDSEDLNFMSNYAGFVYCFVNYQLGDAADAKLPSELGLVVEESSFLLYLQTKILREQGRGQEALNYFKNSDNTSHVNFPYLLYLEGKTALGIDNARAERKLSSYLQLAPNGTYIKSSYRYLAWVALMRGDQLKAKEFQQKIFTEGEDFTGADRQALFEAKRGLNPVLIKARVYFDAGLTEQALKILLDNPDCCSSEEEKQEYFYRKGRVEQKLGETGKAEDSFTRALSFTPEHDTYAGANSALQLAYLKVDKSQTNKALIYFKKALKFDDFPFYEGIHQRAKAGIDNLRK